MMPMYMSVSASVCQCFENVFPFLADFTHARIMLTQFSAFGKLLGNVGMKLGEMAPQG